MRVYLMRHGIAVDRDDPNCPPDPERPLTAEGRERTRQAALGLKWLGIAPDPVLTSPYTRAQQTAQIVLEVLGISRLRPIDADELLPEADPSLLPKVLPRRSSAQVLCVGHLPHLDLAIARLLAAPAAVTQLRKAGVVCLDVPATGAATLRWALTPKLLRRLAG
jgi:phosphohistidine phosphatase